MGQFSVCGAEPPLQLRVANPNADEYLVQNSRAVPVVDWFASTTQGRLITQEAHDDGAERRRSIRQEGRKKQTFLGGRGAGRNSE